MTLLLYAQEKHSTRWSITQNYDRIVTAFVHFSARTNVMLTVMLPHGIFTAVFVVQHASFKKYVIPVLYIM